MAESQIITIVLVHGAFAESLSNWKPVLELLLAKGYKVVAAPNPLRGVSSDAAYVSSILNTIDSPIILVGHSCSRLESHPVLVHLRNARQQHSC
jgi:pimeloyl-ACP methyl ester carboxylesterase